MTKLLFITYTRYNNIKRYNRMLGLAGMGGELMMNREEKSQCFGSLVTSCHKVKAI